MNKQKGGAENEHLNEEMLAVVKEIEKGMHSVEQATPVYTPNLEWFEQMVVEQKHQSRKKLIIDILLFSIIAFLLLTAVLFTLYSLPVVFFALQGFVAIMIVGYFLLKRIKQVRET
ncbi:YxlC family protein [Cytobacillus sp. FJAT-53684]|uniref:YxlC family protein n=1 Tax=Cytobacillus mangrovibacter TaxID=3299024 RepID=A0ABW6JYV6_9BACI